MFINIRVLKLCSTDWKSSLIFAIQLYRFCMAAMKVLCTRKNIFPHRKYNLLFLPCNMAAIIIISPFCAMGRIRPHGYHAKPLLCNAKWVEMSINRFMPFSVVFFFFFFGPTYKKIILVLHVNARGLWENGCPWNFYCIKHFI